MDMKKLTIKQQAFADKYIETGNATQSAIYAGYSEKTASAIGEQNLRKLDIKAYIEKALNPINNDRIMRRDEALELMASLARGETKETTVVFVGEGVQDTIEIPTPVTVRKQALDSILKRHDVVSKDELGLRKLELEIKKLERETETEETLEDKLDVIIDGFDKLSEDNTDGDDTNNNNNNNNAPEDGDA